MALRLKSSLNGSNGSLAFHRRCRKATLHCRFSRRWIGNIEGSKPAADSVANHQTNSGRLRLRQKLDYVCNPVRCHGGIFLIAEFLAHVILKKLQGFAIAVECTDG